MAAALQAFGAGRGGLLVLERIATPDEKAEIRRLLRELRARVTANIPSQHRRAEFEIEAARFTDPTAANLQVLFLAATADVSRWDDHQALLVPAPSQTGCTVSLALTHAFSRGSVHVSSSDPTAHPRLDPQFFADKLDLLAMNIGFRVISE